jgi:hypothetical protein
VETVSQGEISRTPLEQAAAGRQKAGQREEKMTAKHKGCGKGGRAASAAAAFLLFPAEALAHASDRGHILLLPTGHYLAGGAAAVALTFLVLAFVPQRALDRLFFWRMPLGALPLSLRFPASALSFAFLVFLVAAGFLGSGDPLTNPLPLMVWAMFWVGLTLAQAAFGDVWRFLDPWYAPWRVLSLLTGRKGKETLPARLGYWPALLQFFAFAWFELVHPAPDDPEILARAVTVYFAVNLAAAFLFGHEAWSRQGECLSAFLRMIARVGIVEGRAQDGNRLALSLCLPGGKLVNAAPLPASGALFLLLALSSVSFDGLMRTFFWLGLIGVNPLEFPGRSAVIASSTILAVALGERLAGSGTVMRRAAGALVWSIVPIAAVYHFAHYLPSLVIDAQYALASLADPFRRKLDLFGAGHLHVHAGALTGADRVWLLWNLQAGAIVGGHLLAVMVAHAIAFRLHGGAARTALSQAPLALLMVGYTVLGLWLLAAPSA